jgi:integrase
MEWIKANPFKKFTIGAEIYGDPITLYKNELEKLYSFDLSNNSKLDKVRDIFVFQCCIGSRYGDMTRFTPENIQGNFIVYIPQKTKNETADTVRIPMNDKAKAILSKYTSSEGINLPFISNVNFNLYLKELFTLAGITRQVVRLNPKTGREESISLAEIASSHLARRTFIDVLFKAGIKDSIIASMTGHSDNSKAFARYYNIDDKQKADVINLI